MLDSFRSCHDMDAFRKISQHGGTSEKADDNMHCLSVKEVKAAQL